MYGYIYLTTNLVNNKKYIGSHKYNKKSLDERYLGSGKTLAKAIKKYGRNNFACEVLEYCDTREDLIIAEQYYIAKHNAVDSNEYYNIDDGRGNSHEYSTDELTKLKLSNIQKEHITINNDNIQLVINKSNLNEYLEKGFKLGRLPRDYSNRINKFKATHYSEEYSIKRNEWKENIRKAVKGKKWVTNGTEDKQVTLEESFELINNGWRYGRIFAKGKK